MSFFSVRILLVALEGVTGYSFQHLGTLCYKLFTVLKLYPFKQFSILEKENAARTEMGTSGQRLFDV